VRLLPPPEEDYKPQYETFEWTKEPPNLSPESAGIYELLGLECNPDTHKVSNPRKGERKGYNSDDTAQVLVHVHKLVQQQGYTKKHDDRSKRSARIRAETMSADWGSRGYVAHMPSQASSAPRNWGKGKRGW
jgi:hypothetical protein